MAGINHVAQSKETITWTSVCIPGEIPASISLSFFFYRFRVSDLFLSK